jgi:geranylgeranyl pyrophosphate synthase
VYTLPVLRALDAPGVGQDLAHLLGGPVERPEAEKARQMVIASGGVESAIVVARAWADRAAATLADMTDGANGRVLANVGHALLDQLPMTGA